MCIIELVDFNETYVEGVAPKAAPKTRRSRGAKKEVAVEEAEVVAEGAEVAEVAEEKKPAAKKPAAKKPAAPKAPKATAAKTSGAKVQAVKTGASKKA
jgi:hypothetical protein